MRNLADVIFGLACVGIIWGLVWGIFLPKWIWLSVASMVVGLVYCVFTED